MKSGASLEEQLDRGLERIQRRAPNVGALAYFQSYTNTYVDGARFREVLDIVAKDAAVVDGMVARMDDPPSSRSRWRRGPIAYRTTRSMPSQH